MSVLRGGVDREGKLFKWELIVEIRKTSSIQFVEKKNRRREHLLVQRESNKKCLGLRLQ